MRQCGDLSQCVAPDFGGREARTSGGFRVRAGNMASVTLKNIKKIYPNTEKKKKPKKGEPE